MKDLYDIHTAVAAEGFTHPYSLGLFRSDYMLHAPPGEKPVVHQVEFNTIASSFGGLASRVSDLHRHLIASGSYPSTEPALSLDNVPANPAAAGLAAGLAEAHEAYGPAASGREKAVVFLCQPGERNVFDQRWLEYLLLTNHGVRTHRLTLAEVADRTYIPADDAERRLVLRRPTAGDVEVSTVYFRAGYTPDDYPDRAAWAARLHLERSRAIKCPTVATQLAGAKKVQQALAVPGILERFLSPSPSPSSSSSSSPSSVAEQIRGTFAAIYPLDATSEAGKLARRLAFDHPERYVLKPQREGGGNNIYRAKIPPFLKEIGERNWPAYILMELIEPPPASAVIVRAGEARRGPVIGELGVYGVALWSAATREVKVNRECGWLLRTKGRDSEEGGVAAGFGCVDGVCLVD